MTDLDVGATARLLGVSERTIRRWLKEGRLAGLKVGGRIRINERAAREAARPYGELPQGAPGPDLRAGGIAPEPDVDPIVAWLNSPERPRERRERAARIMDEIRARSKPSTGPDDTVEAYLREMRAEQDAKADRLIDSDRH